MDHELLRARDSQHLLKYPVGVEIKADDICTQSNSNNNKKVKDKECCPGTADDYPVDDVTRPCGTQCINKEIPLKEMSIEEAMERCPPHDDIPPKPLEPLARIPEADLADSTLPMFDNMCIEPRFSNPDKVICCAPSDRQNKDLVQGAPVYKEPPPPNPTCNFDYPTDSGLVPCDYTPQCHKEAVYDPIPDIRPCDAGYKCGNKVEYLCRTCNCPGSSPHVEDCNAAPYQTVDMDITLPKTSKFDETPPHGCKNLSGDIITKNPYFHSLPQ